MRRRDLIFGLLGAAAHARGSYSGTSILLNLADRRILSVEGTDFARRQVAPPGSTVKPLSLLALIDSGKLDNTAEFPCPGTLFLKGRSLACSHPPATLPMNVTRAIAYSCNCAVAYFAKRFGAGELPDFFVRMGLSSATGLLGDLEAVGWMQRNLAGDACSLQALGEEGIRVTPLELLGAYARLAHRVGENRIEPILQGLEDAVEFGTAQGARVKGVRVAGKTGSVQIAPGLPAAWFAGFAPSRAPEVAVVVLVPGRSGGSDAAPIAGRLLSAQLGA